MKPRSYLSILFPYFIAIPLGIALLVIGGSLFFYSQINSHFTIKQTSYAKWITASNEVKTYSVNAAKVKSGMDYFKNNSTNEMASVQAYLAQNSDETNGVRVQSVAASTQSLSARDYESSYAIIVSGHTGDVFSLLVNIQNRYPNVEFSQLSLAPESSGLVQLSATLSLIKLQ
jgi:hypothetical protein